MESRAFPINIEEYPINVLLLGQTHPSATFEMWLFSFWRWWYLQDAGIERGRARDHWECPLSEEALSDQSHWSYVSLNWDRKLVCTLRISLFTLSTVLVLSREQPIFRNVVPCRWHKSLQHWIFCTTTSEFPPLPGDLSILLDQAQHNDKSHIWWARDTEKNWILRFFDEQEIVMQNLITL